MFARPQPGSGRPLPGVTLTLHWRATVKRLLRGILALVACLGLATPAAHAAPIKIGYSDWPGWLPFEIGKQKGFFKDAGVDVEMVWFSEYGACIDAFTAGKLDGIAIDCASSLTTKSSTIILLTDYSNGNDMIIGKQGVDSIKDLKGKTVGLEENLVEHL